MSKKKSRRDVTVDELKADARAFVEKSTWLKLTTEHPTPENDEDTFRQVKLQIGLWFGGRGAMPEEAQLDAILKNIVLFARAGLQASLDLAGSNVGKMAAAGTMSSLMADYYKSNLVSKEKAIEIPEPSILKIGSEYSASGEGPDGKMMRVTMPGSGPAREAWREAFLNAAKSLEAQEAAS